MANNHNGYLPFSCPSSNDEQQRSPADLPRQQGLLAAIDSASRNGVAIPAVPNMPRLQHSTSSNQLTDQDCLLAILDEAINCLNECDEANSFERRMPLQSKQ